MIFTQYGFLGKKYYLCSTQIHILKLLNYTFTLFLLTVFSNLSAQNACWTTSTGNIGNSSIFTCDAGVSVSTADTLYVRHAVTIGTANNQIINFSSYNLEIIELQNNASITPYGANNELTLPEDARILINSGSSIVQPGNQSQGTAINIPTATSTICVWGTKCCAGNQSIIGPAQLINTDPCNFTVPLPVTILHFDAKLNSGAVVLSWSVSDEKNFKHYEIMRSSDGINFYSIGILESSHADAPVKTYSFTDNNPYNGSGFYQLRTVDLDGSSSLGKIVHILNGNNLSEVARIYPNPAGQLLTVDLSGSIINGAAQITILSMNGQEVILKNDLYAVNNRFGIQIDSLEPGLYLIQVSDENGLLAINRFQKN